MIRYGVRLNKRHPENRTSRHSEKRSAEESSRELKAGARLSKIPRFARDDDIRRHELFSVRDTKA